MTARHSIRFGILFGTLAALAGGQNFAAAEKEEAKLADNQIAAKDAAVKDAAAENGPVWSANVNGLQGRIELPHSAVFVGTPLIATHLHLRNVSGSAYAMKLPWASARMTFRVTNGAGEDMPDQGGSYEETTTPEVDLVLPHGATICLNISHHAHGVPHGQLGMLDLGEGGGWVLKKEDGVCTLHAVLEMDGNKKEVDPLRQNWQGRIELPPVLIPTSVTSPHPPVTDEMLQELGQKLIGGDRNESHQADEALSWLIADERVIPWYVKAMDTKSRDLKRSALDRLSRFPGDAALGALKKGMNTQAADIGDPPFTGSDRTKMAADIRHCAANALAVSTHPDAKGLLLTMWKDPSRGVRLTVIQQGLGKMTTEESLARLKQMGEDSDEMVRGEAVRYLKLCAAKAATPADDGKAGEP